MDPAVLRDDMVAGLEHEAKGVLRTDLIADAMRQVPRREFVPEERSAYADRDHEHLGTRIFAPRTVARLLEALDPRPDQRVLVVGAGVGYTSAVLAELVGGVNVHALDISRPLVYEARENVSRAGYEDVLVDRGDGSYGLPAYAPYDRILVEAAALSLPHQLVDQLTPTGRVVYPRGGQTQRLEAVDASGRVEGFGVVAFDPLLVEGEQSGAIERNRTAREDDEHARNQASHCDGGQHEWEPIL